MRLKRLIIQGFKSFKDRTTVNFDDGITGIVGPNGCGKSNIVDALFWVMGEQSAKHLRGKSMKDLIFSGSSKYNPGVFAEATLVLENNEGKHIHIGNKVSSPSEIQLTRKLYRNGETEYRINNEPARLRDIQEVFMDTGAGAKSYSIIAQGEINRLVQAKPEERRVMIEEVAGITKFKARKRESMRKIEATQLNLSRLSDLQVEIEKNLRSLQKQAEKAERARSLKDKIRRNDLVVNSHKVFEYLKSFKEDQARYNELELELEGWKTQKNSFEISLEDERLQKDDQSEKIEELQKKYNELSRELAAAEEKFNYLCKSLTEKENLIDSRKEEATEIQEEIDNRSKRFEDLKLELDKLEEQREEGFDCSDLEEQVESLKEELDLKKDALSDIKEQLAESQKELSTIEQTAFRNNSKLEEYATSLQDITTEIEALEKQYSGVSKDIADEREESLSAKEKVEALSESEVIMKAEIDELKSSVKSQESELNIKHKELIQSESKLQSLIEINESLEGLKEGSGKLLDEKSEGFHLFGTLIKCDEKYVGGVQSLLREFLDYVVVENREDFHTWLESQSEVSVDGIVPGKNGFASVETIERLKLKLPEIKSVIDLLDIESSLKEKLTPFLQGYYLVDELNHDQMKMFNDEAQFKAISSFNGQHVLRNEHGALVYDISNSESRASGVIERNNRIEELTILVGSLKEDLPSMEESLEVLKEKLETQSMNHDALRDELSEAKSNSASLSSALESKLNNMESGNARLEILNNRKSEVSKLRLELLEGEEEINKNEEALKEKVSDLSENFEELQESLEMITDNYNQQKEELVEKQIQAKSFNERLENSSSQIQDVEGQIERSNQRMQSNTQRIQGYEEEIEQINQSIAELEKNNQERVESLQDQEDVLNVLRDAFSELLLGMQEREDKVKKLNTDINKGEKQMVELSSKRDRIIVDEEQIVRNIFEKYKVDLRLSLGDYLEYEEDDYQDLADISSMYVMETEEGLKEIEKEDFSFTRRYGQDLKDCEYKFKNYKTEFNRLGEINWQAIEDYERQKLRFDFLKVQEEELRSSLTDLEQAIAHIDEKSKQRFKIAYEEVDTRFRRVFPIIFGGGDAQLKLTADIKDPECGVEIIAQPPGKKMQNINLMSGGEKAMTAVSLIFSIFLVKPSPFCLLDEVDAPLDDANVGRFNELLREMSKESQFILITHNKKTMELNDTLYGVTMQEPGVSKAVSVQLH